MSSSDSGAGCGCLMTVAGVLAAWVIIIWLVGALAWAWDWTAAQW